MPHPFWNLVYSCWLFPLNDGGKLFKIKVQFNWKKNISISSYLMLKVKNESHFNAAIISFPHHEKLSFRNL